MSTRAKLRVCFYAFSAILLHLAVNWSALSVLGAITALYLITGGWRFAWVVVKTSPRDFSALVKFKRTQLEIRWLASRSAGIPTLFEETVRRHPQKSAFVFEGVKWTFQEIENYSNAVGHYFINAGYRRNSVIAVYMESRPEFVATWLGLAKVGLVPALINFNLRMDGLAHCISTADCQALVFGSELSGAVKDVLMLLKSDVRLYQTGTRQSGSESLCSTWSIADLDSELLNSPTSSPCPRAKYDCHGTLMYIYTSGTTGMPKAAKISHSRYYYMSITLHYFFHMTSNDVIYDPLPLYHSAGGILGVGQALIKGCTVVVRRKFSASSFWKDCIENQCTAVQYIGEICRYLLAQPPRDDERRHRVRLAYGNGLRPQIWQEFQQRFGISRIGEFYGATEGNASIANTDNTVGVIGWLTLILPQLYPVYLIKVDPSTGQVIRSSNGLCLPCAPGEAGEMIGKIVRTDPFRNFDGYANEEATQKKIIHDVFAKGDMYFLSGDILQMDAFGYLSFRDRTGDTFRWRGENVSTAEIEAVISNLVDKRDAVVYGVEIPGVEGKAGMAAIGDIDGTLDLEKLGKSLQLSLPAYARPIFLRIMKAVDSTGTFKLMKVDMQKAGYDPAKVAADQLYYLNQLCGNYCAVDSSVYLDIVKGRVRF